MSYRRIPETTLWHQINDCMSALRYIDENRSKLNLILDKCFLTGDSAGALLSYYIASINGSKELQNDFGIDGCSVDFKAMGLISIMLETDRHELMDFITTYISDENDEGKTYFPYIFDASGMLAKATLPPVYLVTGDEDMIQNETMKFDSLLSEHGVKHELKNYPKGDIHSLDHVFATKNPECTESQEAIDLMSDHFMRNS
ncbi:MAG: alpha/beta hydrolase [Ruminiclostridium sp.]|nr:alpha/beta hydrolase [Ruminiclostridium sp.]